MILSKALSNLYPRRRPAPPAGITLGREASFFKRDIQLTPSELCRHVAIQGRIGSCAPQLMREALCQQTRQGGGWIYFDTQHDPATAKQLQAFAIAAGRERDFAFLNFDIRPRDDGPTPGSYSLVSNGTAEQIAARLLHALPSLSVTAPGAEFYYQMGRRVLTAVIGVLHAGSQPLSLQLITEALSNPEKLNSLVAGLPDGHPLTLEISELMKGYFPESKGLFNANLLSQVSRGLAGRLMAVTAPLRHAKSESAPSVDVLDTLVKNRMVYIAAPVMMMSKDSTSLTLMKMLIDDIQCALPAYADAKKASAVRETHLPFMVMCQDPALYAKSLYAVAAQARAFGISLWSQSAGQAHCAYTEGVLANSATKILFSGTAEHDESALNAFGAPGLTQQIARLSTGEFIVLRPGEHRAQELRQVRGRMYPPSIGS